MIAVMFFSFSTPYDGSENVGSTAGVTVIVTSPPELVVLTAGGASLVIGIPLPLVCAPAAPASRSAVAPSRADLVTMVICILLQVAFVDELLSRGASRTPVSSFEMRKFAR